MRKTLLLKCAIILAKVIKLFSRKYIINNHQHPTLMIRFQIFPNNVNKFMCTKNSALKYDKQIVQKEEYLFP